MVAVRMLFDRPGDGVIAPRTSGRRRDASQSIVPPLVNPVHHRACLHQHPPSFYSRREDRVTLDKVVKINIRG